MNIRNRLQLQDVACAKRSGVILHTLKDVMSSAWKLLRTSSLDTTGTPLLIKHEIGPSNYVLWLTDLTHVWTDSQDRRSIIQKAFATDTSIDPTEDAGQMRLLLLSIQKALDSEAGTRVEVSASEKGRQISMKLSTPLPASLPPLRWETTLQKCPPSTLTMKLIVPLLNDQLSAKAEKSSLVQQLRDKDTIISKLFNQLQADGSDMSRVFPGAVSARQGNRVNMRQTIGKSVKGVAEFDENIWRHRMSSEHSPPVNLRDLLFGVSPIVAAKGSESFYVPETEAWWEQSGQHKPAGEGFQPDENPSGHSESEMDMDDKEGFQLNTSHQPRPFTGPLPTDAYCNQTPVPRGNSPLASKKHVNSRKSSSSAGTTLKPSPDHASSTTDGSDDHRTHSCLQESFAPTEANSTRHANEDTMRNMANDKRFADVDSRSDRSSMDLNVSPSPSLESLPHEKTSQTQTQSRVKSKLGKIGGKKKTAIPELASEVIEENHPKHPRALGDAVTLPDIKKDPPEMAPMTKPTHREARAEKPTKQPTPPRETSQERANRNRERLKRDLDAKSHTGLKKKRKF
ncbi:MAG: hypothetical protein Q9163_001241 [Psora crenata]